ncbi:hypothetical protein D3C80_2027400 [compost metagenome]
MVPSAVWAMAVRGATPQPSAALLIEPSPFTMKRGEKVTASDILIFSSSSAEYLPAIILPSASIPTTCSLVVLAASR